MNHSVSVLYMNITSSTAPILPTSSSLSSSNNELDMDMNILNGELRGFENTFGFNGSIPTDFNSSNETMGGNITNLTCYTSPYHRSIYPIALPVMITLTILSVFVNLLIVISARWCRRPISPTLYLSISLALADGFASFVLGAGLIVNSLLPCVYEIVLTNPCFPLTIEAIRLAGILITVKHLLALGINHWIGIVRPLHYAATMTRRTAWFVILFSWICPIILVFTFFTSHPGQGFLDSRCETNTFLNQKTFRALFASLFFGPLIIMSMIYLHIFFIVRNHHQHRLQYQRNNEEESCHQFRRNIKAVVTTILILGTYILGWIPGILWFIIVCQDCVIPLSRVPQHVAVPVSIMNNSLIILKAFVNPIIYAARMSDIKIALKKMQYDILSRLCRRCIPVQPPVDPLERGFSKYHRSLCETRSLRMSSRGSTNSSARRTTGMGSIHNTASNHHHHHHHGQPPLINHCNHNDNSHENGNRVTFEMNDRSKNHMTSN